MSDKLDESVKVGKIIEFLYRTDFIGLAKKYSDSKRLSNIEFINQLMRLAIKHDYDVDAAIESTKETWFEEKGHEAKDFDLNEVFYWATVEIPYNVLSQKEINDRFFNFSVDQETIQSKEYNWIEPDNLEVRHKWEKAHPGQSYEKDGPAIF